MRALSDTVLQFGYRVWQVKPPTPSIMVVIKATLDFRRDQPCVLAEEQVPCGGDVHHDDDEECSLLYENDFAILKPRGECFVTGSVFVAAGRQTRELQAGFRIGEVQKNFHVFGDRYWKVGLTETPSEPSPFHEMPLRPERAFGGPDHSTNPWGVGYKGHAPEVIRQLPNIERSDSLVRSPRSKPKPVVTTAIPVASKSRMKLAGTYDQRYLNARWPFFPEDFNWEFFLAAPTDQRIQMFWRGDEEIALVNLHRQHSKFKTSLPDIRPRAFLYRAPAKTYEDFTEIPMALDTITVDTDQERVFCLWRGLTDVRSEDLEDVENLFYLHEEVLAKTPTPDIYERFLVLLQEEDEEGEEEEELAPTVVRGLDVAMTVVDRNPPLMDEAPKESEEEAPQPPAELQQVLQGMQVPEVDPPDPQDLKKRLLAAPYPVPPELIAALDDEEEEPGEEPDAEPDITERERFLQMLQAGGGFQGAVFENIDLSGFDLSGENLEGVSFVGAIFVETSFHGAQLKHAQLSGCELMNARFSRAGLEDADLTGCSARGASFSEANLEGLTAIDALLDDCDMTAVRGTDASFSGACLKGARFSGAELTRADFSGADVEGASFIDACLEDADFERARASGARFDRANLSRLRAAEGADFSNCSLRNVAAPGAMWDDSNLQHVDLRGSDLNGAFFSSARLFRATLDGCQIANGSFAKATLSHASFRSANLFEADLEGADLSFADFTAANLFGAEVWKANMNGAVFTSANVKRTKIGVLST